MNLVVYTRLLAEGLTDSKGVHGVRGMLRIGSASWPTVERIGPGAKMLPPGDYVCELGEVTLKTAVKMRAIRFLGEYSAGRIYVHPANQPNELEGCIAVGLDQTENGVGRSRVAMNSVIAALGGWKPSTKLSAKVIAL